MFYPTLEEARKLAEKNSVIPISMELFSDQKTSMEILKSIRGKSDRFFLLESVPNQESWGRYSFLGFAPKMVLGGTDGILSLSRGTLHEHVIGEPVKIIRDILQKYKSPRIKGLPPFTGGFVGFFSYDFVKYCIPGLKLKSKDYDQLPDFSLMLIDRVIAFDNYRQKIFLIVNADAANIDNTYIDAISALKDMERIILDEAGADIAPPELSPFSPVHTKEQYCKMVEKAKHHIREGDIFQAVLSNRFEADCRGELLHTYRLLRTTSPSPYMVYMRIKDTELVCASPETMVTLRDGKLDIFPLAGTRPRGTDEEEDKALAKDLLSDPKELAEHDMLVDLARNDLGKISKFGSVKVSEFHAIKRFSHVMHISSRVSGEMRPECDALDAIAATLPAGTLSGAPKKRACEIIDALENCKRGPYGGAIGYIDFTGNMDLCIGIRMAVKKGKKVFVQAGAGIVADSVPEKEYVEIQNKARAIINALTDSKEASR